MQREEHGGKDSGGSARLPLLGHRRHHCGDGWLHGGADLCRPGGAGIQGSGEPSAAGVPLIGSVVFLWLGKREMLLFILVQDGL